MIINNIKKSYGDKCVLNIANLNLEAGKIYAIIGANGSGKSTLLKCLANIEKDDDNKEVLDKNLIVTYMPQKTFAFKMSLLDNILLGLDKSYTDIAKRLIDMFNMQELINKRADRFSGGESQKMALMRVLIRNSNLVLLDEPTSAMDSKAIFVAEDLIKDYIDENKIIILVTHSLKQALRVADEIIFMANGEIIERNSSLELCNNPKELLTKEFIENFGA